MQSRQLRTGLLAGATTVLLMALTAHGAKICIDPGHGGSDPGAVGNGLRESDMNLNMSLRARDMFNADGWTTIMTRTTDVYVSLSGRTSYANSNGADRFICVHCNSFSDSSANGTETFCHPSGSSNSYDLRNKVQAEMVSHMGTTNRGNKTATFYVLSYTNMPSILTEVAFISNPSDAAKLGNPAYRHEAARAILHGTQSHYGIAPHDPGPPPADWAATYQAQSFPSSMEAGSTAIVWAEFVNQGEQAWYHAQTYLGTSSPQDRNSPFCNMPNWPNCTRPTEVDQSEVVKGAVGRFTFILKAPTTPGSYTEKYKLVREGITWFGPEISWTINVTASAGNVTGTITNASNGSPIAAAAVTLTGVGNTTTNSSGVYNFSNVNAGTYAISVSATGFSPASGSVTVNGGATTTKNFALTVSDTQPPTVPTGLAGNATGPTSVQLTWSASTDNVGVTGYEIRRDGGAIGTSTGTSYTDNAATPGATQSYQVRAKDAVPNYSAWSAPASVTTPHAPPQPTVVFSDGFSGNLNQWTQGTSAYAYSTDANHGSLTGAGAAFMAAGESDQMYHAFTRPFAQGVVSGWFYDGKGGWKPTVCGLAYRQALSLRPIDGAANMFIDNEFYSAADNTKYFFRLVGNGGITHTAYATRNPNTDCNGAWIHFETTVTPGAPGASPQGAFTAKVTDGAGTTSTVQNLTTDFSSYGIGRITLGLGVSSVGEGYWDDISFTATPPGIPIMVTPVAGQTQIAWNFDPADNNLFGWDVADAGGTIKSPQYPASGWLDRAANGWTETALTANTQYTRKVRAWNGTLNSPYSDTVSAWTLSVAPAAGSITADTPAPCEGDEVTWTAVGGFGAGKVAYYAYAWNQSPTHMFNGSESIWDADSLATSVTATGTWYLHVLGMNAADQPNGSYSYSVEAQGCVSPSIVAAVSRRTHGLAGDFETDVWPAGAIECRTNGPALLVVTFDSPIQGAGGLDIADVTVSSGTVSNLAIDGSELTITMSGAVDGQNLIVAFPGIVSAGGLAVTDTLCIGMLTGDATGDRVTNIFDLIAVRNTLNAAVTGVNCANDVNADGLINIFDLIAVRNNLNHTVSACP